MELSFKDAASGGREFLDDGYLEDLRKHFTLSYTRMATFLHTNSKTLKRWMSEPEFAANIHDTTAARIGQFAYDLIMKIKELREQEIEICDLYPLSLLAGQMGRSITSPSFQRMCQSGEITCYDMGDLGVYIPKFQADKLKAAKR